MSRRRDEKCGWIREQIGNTVILKAEGAFEPTASWHIDRAIVALGGTRAKWLLIDLSNATFAHDGFDAGVLIESLNYRGFQSFRIGIVATGNAAKSLILRTIVTKVYATREEAKADLRSWGWHPRLLPYSRSTSARPAFRSWCQHCGRTHPRFRSL
ncbi:MAG: hypothetical protein IT290_01655 [Deltaproteobacteria bacterium]|nr:hypothetical protein [Deltaproteobacteria bacterium]